MFRTTFKAISALQMTAKLKDTKNYSRLVHMEKLHIEIVH